MHRKAEVKEIITEVIESMSDDEDVEEAESGDESGKDGDDEWWALRATRRCPFPWRLVVHN